MDKLARQRKTKAPCPKCFLHPERCLCDEFPTLTLATRLTLVVHAKELKRTTNTGRLAVAALTNSEIFVRGEGRDALDLSALADTSFYVPPLLYPSEDAAELTPDFVAGLKRPVHLIVPDGNWRQASKVHTRHPELKDIARVKLTLPEGLRRQHLRRETSPHGMATLEAIAWAMSLLEGESARPLHDLYQLKLKRTLEGRGFASATV